MSSAEIEFVHTVECQVRFAFFRHINLQMSNQVNTNCSMGRGNLELSCNAFMGQLFLYELQAGIPKSGNWRQYVWSWCKVLGKVNGSAQRILITESRFGWTFKAALYLHNRSVLAFSCFQTKITVKLQFACGFWSRDLFLAHLSTHDCVQQLLLGNFTSYWLGRFEWINTLFMSGTAQPCSLQQV